MIFSAEPRFSKTIVSSSPNSSIQGFSKSATEAHIGPGSYIAAGSEEIRGGWKPTSFNNRQPMSNKSKVSRSEHYISGVMTPHGTMSVPQSPKDRNSPGPGYYEGKPSIFSFSQNSPTVTLKLFY